MKPQKSLHMLIVAAIVLNVTFLLNACRDDDTGPQLCQSINYVSGNNQIGTTGQTLKEPLKVRVIDEKGIPKPDVTVTWVVESGGGSVTPGTSTTNAAGEAEASWTLGSGTGAQKVKASIQPVRAECTQSTAVDFTTEPATITLTDAQIVSDNVNSKCSKSTDEGYEVTLSYTSNVNLSNYYVEIVTEWTASNGQKGSFEGTIGKEVTADKIIKYNCFTFGTAIWIDEVFKVRIYARSITGEKTGPVLAESNPVGPQRIEKSKPTVPTFSISKVTSTLKGINSSSCSNGGSLFEYSIEYITNAPLSSYYVEVITDGSALPSGKTFNLVQKAYGVDNSLARVLVAICWKFNDDVSARSYFTVKLYNKTENGEKTGAALVTSNRFGPITDTKPAGGARISAEATTDEEPGSSSAVPFTYQSDYPTQSLKTIGSTGIQN